MNKLSKTLLALCLGATFITSGFAADNNQSATTITTATNTQQVSSLQQMQSSLNSVVATYDKNIVLFSEIKPYLPKKKQTFTSDEIHSAVDKYIATKLEAEWKAKATKAVPLTSYNEALSAFRKVVESQGAPWQYINEILAQQGTTLAKVVKNYQEGLTTEKRMRYIQENVKPVLDRDAIEFEGYKLYEIAKARGTLKQIDTNQVSYILIKQNPVLSAEEAKEKAESIYKQLQDKSLSFEEAARKYSDDITSAANGGFLGKTKDLPAGEIFDQQLEKAKPSDIVKPFPIEGYGYVIVRLDDKVKTAADLNYYTNEAFQNYVKEQNKDPSFAKYLLSSVIIRYADIEYDK